MTGAQFRGQPVGDVTWMNDALCLGVDPDLFFPEVGEPALSGHAKAICFECPVRAACLDYALKNHEHHGVWGGTSEKERRQIRRRRRTPAVAS